MDKEKLLQGCSEQLGQWFSGIFSNGSISFICSLNTKPSLRKGSKWSGFCERRGSRGWRAGSPVLLPPSPELLGSLVPCLDQPLWSNHCCARENPEAQGRCDLDELAQACLVLAGVCGVEVNEGPRGQRSETSETRQLRNM